MFFKNCNSIVLHIISSSWSLSMSQTPAIISYILDTICVYSSMYIYLFSVLHRSHQKDFYELLWTSNQCLWLNSSLLIILIWMALIKTGTVGMIQTIIYSSHSKHSSLHLLEWPIQKFWRMYDNIFKCSLKGHIFISFEAGNIPTPLIIRITSKQKLLNIFKLSKLFNSKSIKFVIQELSESVLMIFNR